MPPKTREKVKRRRRKPARKKTFTYRAYPRGTRVWILTSTTDELKYCPCCHQSEKPTRLEKHTPVSGTITQVSYRDHARSAGGSHLEYTVSYRVNGQAHKTLIYDMDPDGILQEIFTSKEAAQAEADHRNEETIKRLRKQWRQMHDEED